MKIYKCRDCGFLDNPPHGCYNLDKCPYCHNDDWEELRKVMVIQKVISNSKAKTK